MQTRSPAKVAVIAGAAGVVGKRLSQLLVHNGWQVVGLARNPVEIEGVRWIAVDLLDPVACREKLATLTDATHVFSAARYDFAEGGREPIEENLAIVRNLVDTLDESSPGLSHVHLVHGIKYYGSHVGPYPTPAKESDPRSPVPNFYYAQQDYVAAKQRGARWTWSSSRPAPLIHGTPGTARNLVSIIAAYALLCRELGQPFSFPGTPSGYEAINECTSTEHLAEGLLWMGGEPSARNQPYNLTNGDVFRWKNLWPAFANYFDVPLGPVRAVRLWEAMADKAPVWQTIVARHGLRAEPLSRVAAWDYADYIWSRGWDVMCSMTKARLHGFHRTVDTESEFIRYFDELRTHRVIA
ncbi:MAG: SDR family oxidoreductase [Pigmentiphaga sp.]